MEFQTFNPGRVEFIANELAMRMALQKSSSCTRDLVKTYTDVYNTVIQEFKKYHNSPKEYCDKK